MFLRKSIRMKITYQYINILCDNCILLSHINFLLYDFMGL